MADEQEKPAPYTGLKVMDFTSVLAGPSCARLLADLGAEVIKIEAPEGDRIRFSSPARDSKSATFAQLNAGKRNLCLDMKTDGAKEIVYRLAKDMDLVVENFRPGVGARLGVTYEAFRAVNPRIIHCSISGFGQTGPFATRPAYAPIIHATSGFDRAQMRDRTGAEVPRGTGVLVADFAGGLTAYAAIATALYHRERTGEGQHIDCALIDGIQQILSCELQDGQFPDAVGPRLDYPPVKAKDGWLVIVPTSDTQFQAMAKAMGHPEWIDDARFGPYMARMENSRLLVEHIQEWAKDRACAEIETLMAKVGAPCATIHTMADIYSHPQFVHRGSFAEIEDWGGPMKVGNTPFRFSAMAGAPRPWVAELGEHNHEILAELGYSEAEIETMEAAGALRA